MKNSNRINFFVTGALFFLFVMLTIMLMHVDVKPIGPEGSCIGFASVNKWVSELLGVNMLLYNITDWLGVVAILFAFGFAILGLIQLIRRKSLKRVDHGILILGAFYLLVIAAYVFFEFNIVNYRPVLIQNVLEASYPSSTTMLVLCVMPTAIMEFNRLIKGRTARITANTASAVLAAFTVVGRLLSGVHWFTDILGGTLLSLALVMLYYSVDKYIESKSYGMEELRLMINVDSWMAELTHKVKVHFKNRLFFVGLQGSYQRKEAHQDSDIDVVVILDTLSIDDLSAYREILLTMPENDKACGFVGGTHELMNWPKHELFQFEQDTRSYHGTLNELLPNIERKDVIDSVKISASGLYHLCCHAAVHTPSNISALKDIYKSAFFLLQAIYYLQNGIYVRTKKELLPLLKGNEQEILNISMNWNDSTIMAKTDVYFDLILRWSGTILDTRF